MLGWSAYSQLFETAKERTFGQIKTLLHQVRLRTESQIRTARANAVLFASGSLVERYIVAKDDNLLKSELHEQLLKEFFSYQLAYPEYYEMRLIRADGKEELRSVLGKYPNKEESESSTDYFLKMTQNVDSIYAAYFLNPDNSEPALLVSKSLYVVDNKNGSENERRSLWGFLALTVSLQFLEEQVETDGIGRRGHLFLADDQGNVLFKPKTSTLKDRLPKPFLKDLQRSALESEVLTAPYDRGRGYFYGNKLHDRMWMYAVLPEGELLTESRRLGFIVAAITFMAMIVTIAFLFGFLRMLIVKPIRQLSDAAREVGRGRVRVSLKINSKDEIGELARSFQEMGTNLDKYHEQVRYLAYHDNLTGLPNRAMFNEYLRHAITEARRGLQEIAVLFLDLDNFKRINDSLGHQTGDGLLEEFSDRVLRCIRRSDVVSRNAPGEATEVLARWAGDEFIVLLPRPSGSAEAQRVAKRILTEVARPFKVGRHECSISTSIGIAIFPNDGVSDDKLVKSADVAMYHAKKLGRNNFQFFSKKLNQEMIQRLTLENKLHRAVEKKEFALVFQPQFDAATGAVVAAEALLRWREMDLGAISPSIFIPIAEESGLIVPITEWVIKEACRKAAEWNIMGYRDLVMSVNISGAHANRGDLEDLVETTLKSTGLPASQLELELTETSILEDPEQAALILGRLKDIGVKLALDDFGTGYSSLSQLKRLPIDKLKIDQSFIQDMENDSDGDAIVSAIIAMSHSLNLQVLAEGVENEQQLSLLRAKGCDLLQGFYCSEPLNAADLTKLLRGEVIKSA